MAPAMVMIVATAMAMVVTPDRVDKAQEQTLRWMMIAATATIANVGATPNRGDIGQRWNQTKVMLDRVQNLRGEGGN